MLALLIPIGEVEHPSRITPPDGAVCERAFALGTSGGARCLGAALWKMVENMMSTTSIITEKTMTGAILLLSAYYVTGVPMAIGSIGNLSYLA